MNGNTDIDLSTFSNGGFWKVESMSNALFKQFFPSYNLSTGNPGDYTIFIFHGNSAGTQNYCKYACGLICSPRVMRPSSGSSYRMTYALFSIWNNQISATYEFWNGKETINQDLYD